MKVVLAPDSFKESMAAADAVAAMARGVRAVVPDADVHELPMSDGGEGFTDAVAASLDARIRDVDTLDALGRPTTGRLAVAGETCVFEMATAAGLEQLAAEDRDVWGSDTRGVGTMVLAALDAGARHLLIGIGGSATNDGGAGMLVALGVRFLDDAGEPIGTTPRELRDLARIDVSGLDPRLAEVRVEVACDVDNPLLGERGASAVFGPQKGASSQDVQELDAVLGRLAEVAGHRESAETPGAGAAGGLGFALLAFLGAQLRPGLDLVAEAVDLDGTVAGADLVLTGEGSVDAQTLAGKTPAGVARAAAAHGVPTVVLAGRVAPDADVLLEAGCTALVPIVPQAQDLDTALAQGAENLERATATVLRLWTHGVRSEN